MARALLITLLTPQDVVRLPDYQQWSMVLSLRDTLSDSSHDEYDKPLTGLSLPVQTFLFR